MQNSCPYRASPYIKAPQNCWQNLATGQVACTTQESYGELNQNDFLGAQLDSPLNRILQRPPTGPWRLVGYATSEGNNNMLVYAQTVDSRRNKYNYRVVDTDGIPMDADENVQWIMSGDTLKVNGNDTVFTLQLYRPYR